MVWSHQWTPLEHKECGACIWAWLGVSEPPTIIRVAKRFKRCLNTIWWMQTEVSKGQSRTCYQECGCHLLTTKFNSLKLYQVEIRHNFCVESVHRILHILLCCRNWWKCHNWRSGGWLCNFLRRWYVSSSLFVAIIIISIMEQWRPSHLSSCLISFGPFI